MIKSNLEISLFQQAAEFLLVMANPARIEILSRVIVFETSVGALVEQVGLSQSAVSQHLAKLRGANLVETRRDAQTIYYYCNSEAVKKVLDALDALIVDDVTNEHKIAV